MAHESNLQPRSLLALFNRRAFEQSSLLPAFCVRVWLRGITIYLLYLEIGQDIQELEWLRLPRQKSKFEGCNAETQL